MLYKVSPMITSYYLTRHMVLPFSFWLKRVNAHNISWLRRVQCNKETFTDKGRLHMKMIFRSQNADVTVGLGTNENIITEHEIYQKR